MMWLSVKSVSMDTHLMEMAARNVIKHPSARPANPQPLMSALHVAMAIIWMEAFVKDVLIVIVQNVQQVHQYVRSTRQKQANSPSKQKPEKSFQQFAMLGA